MRELFLSDVHFPYEDKVAWQLTLAVIRHAQPNLIFWGGDILDAYTCSHFLRDPRRILSIQDELDAVHTGMQVVRESAPNAQMKFIPGNHEMRVVKYTFGRAPDLAFLHDLQIPALMRLKDVEVEALDKDKVHKVGQLYHIHGDEYQGGAVNPARNIWTKTNESVIMGHYHRAMIHYQRTLGDRHHQTIINPCLCDMDPEYSKKPNWQQGVTIIDHSPNGFNATTIVYFPADDRLCAMVDGKLISVESK